MAVRHCSVEILSRALGKGSGRAGVRGGEWEPVDIAAGPAGGHAVFVLRPGPAFGAVRCRVAQRLCGAQVDCVPQGKARREKVNGRRLAPMQGVGRVAGVV